MAPKTPPISAAQIAGKRSKYLSTLTPMARRAVKQIRATVRSTVPGASEAFSYGILGFRLAGQPLVWYAGFANHVSLYPMTAALRRAHAAALEGYKTSSGTVQFPLSAPLPLPSAGRAGLTRCAAPGELTLALAGQA
jgi:uncharacterized protein YdhG (YjbR/CyaY superfamily)